MFNKRFYIPFVLLVLTFTLQAEDRSARRPITKNDAVLERMPAGTRTPQSNNELDIQNKQAAGTSAERTLKRENISATRIPVQIAPSNALHTRPSLKNRRIEAGGRTNESRVLINKRPLPSRPLPISIKLDRRCVPSNSIVLHPFAINPKGSVIELVDGSIWHIKRKRDRHIVRHWNLRDDIIVESYQFLGKKTYKLVNYSREESVEAILSLNDTYEGRASHWITRIDKSREVMELEDGSLWNINAALYEDWKENDGVILGLSHENSGFSLYMIINARTMQHIPVSTLR